MGGGPKCLICEKPLWEYEVEQERARLAAVDAYIKRMQKVRAEWDGSKA